MQLNLQSKIYKKSTKLGTAVIALSEIDLGLV
jgi:hypothetical protein